MRIAVLLLALAACGGNVPRDRALRYAKAARLRGDLVGEVSAMRQACAFDPGNRKLCGRTWALDAFALGTTRASADAACQRVDAAAPQSVHDCLAALGPLRTLFPADPEAERMANVAGNAFVVRCGQEPPAAFAESLRRVRCIETGVEQFQTRGFQAHADRARADAAAVVLGLGAGKAVAGRPGARAVLYSTAACLAGDPAVRTEAARSLAELARTTAPTLHLRATGLAADELCTDTAAALGAVTCVARPDSRAVVLEASVEIPGIQHDVAERSRSERYLASVDRTENPAYRSRARDEQHTRDLSREAEHVYRQDQSACDQYSDAHARAGYCMDCPQKSDKEYACVRAADAKAAFEQRERDWQSARTQLESTPAMLEHENWKQTSFIVKDHTWSVAWQATLRALPGQPVRRSGAATATDSEHPGSDLAEIAADPLAPPARGWHLPEVRTQLAAELARLARTELATRVTALQEKCPGGEPAWSDAAWLDCWAAAAVVGGIGDLGKELVTRETAADNKRIGVELPVPSCR